MFSITAKDDDGKGKDIAKQVAELKRLADEFQVKATQNTGRNPLDTASPNIEKIQEGSSSSDDFLERDTKNARFKTETAKAMLLDARKRQDEAYNAMRAENERLQSIISNMEKLDIDKVNFDEIRNALKDGIKALAKVREQWGKLVRFFQMMSNLIKCCLNTSLKDFVDTSKVARQNLMAQKTLSATFRDLIFEQASEANRIAYAVQMISSTYVTVSSQHLMDKITNLNQLIAIDPKESQKIRIARMQLHNGTTEASQAIQSIMKKQREEFEQQVENRIRRIEREVEAVLPPLPKKEIQAIEETVKKGSKQSDCNEATLLCNSDVVLFNTCLLSILHMSYTV